MGAAAAKMTGQLAPKAVGFLSRAKQLATFGRVKPLGQESARLAQRAGALKTPAAQSKHLGAAQAHGVEALKEVGKGVGLYGGGAAALGGAGYGAHKMLSGPSQPKLAALRDAFFDELGKIGMGL